MKIWPKFVPYKSSRQGSWRPGTLKGTTFSTFSHMYIPIRRDLGQKKIWQALPRFRGALLTLSVPQWYGPKVWNFLLIFLDCKPCFPKGTLENANSGLPVCVTEDETGSDLQVWPTYCLIICRIFSDYWPPVPVSRELQRDSLWRMRPGLLQLPRLHLWVMRK